MDCTCFGSGARNLGCPQHGDPKSTATITVRLSIPERQTIERVRTTFARRPDMQPNDFFRVLMLASAKLIDAGGLPGSDCYLAEALAEVNATKSVP